MLGEKRGSRSFLGGKYSIGIYGWYFMLTFILRPFLQGLGYIDFPLYVLSTISLALLVSMAGT